MATDFWYLIVIKCVLRQAQTNDIGPNTVCRGRGRRRNCIDKVRVTKTIERGFLFYSQSLGGEVIILLGYTAMLSEFACLVVV